MLDAITRGGQEVVMHTVVCFIRKWAVTVGCKWRVSWQACYAVRDVVRRLWQPVLSGPEQTRSKDYISQPKPNGYRSLHETVCVQAATVQAEPGATHDIAGVSHCINLEVQIRTQSEPFPLG